ncbi:MAG: MBL fold metallo-hydrolase [Sediminispirochaetaceae bacterium]
MDVLVSWLGHASFLLSGKKTVYIDPWKIDGEPHDGDLVLISHTHYDHFSLEDIRSVLKEDGEVVGSEDAVQELSFGKGLKPGESLEIGGIKVTGIAAYNVEKEFHPKENGWLGFVVELEGARIYYAGDTDAAEEMKGLSDIDLALIPVGGNFTFGPEDAAEAVKGFSPKKALPYHWGDVVGNRKDAQKFGKKAGVPVEILSPMDTLQLE